MKRYLLDNWKLYTLLLAVLVVGFVLVAESTGFEATKKELVKELGIALVVAAILGLTIDIFLKIRILRDVFDAAFQYVLHPSLKDEVSRILRYGLIADSHEWHVKIERLPGKDKLVVITHELHRRIKNYGSTPEKINVLLHIDEWGFRKPCEIIECSGKLDDGTTVVAKHKKTDTPTILFDAGESITLKPNQTINVRSRWKETKRTNDYTYLNLHTPTIDPVIDVDAPGFIFSRHFGAASEDITETVSTRQIIKGTYLPFHFMLIRWWPKDWRA